MKNLLNYYVKSRQVNYDYGRLFDLLISDKLKESLPPGPLQFVLSKEGTECFQSSIIADLADIHENNKIGMPSYSKQSYGSTLSDKKNSSKIIIIIIIIITSTIYNWRRNTAMPLQGRLTVN